MVPVASSACSSALAGVQAFYAQLLAGVDLAISCSADPVAVGSQITWSSGSVWTIASAGIADSSTGFVVDAFDPVVGAALFVTVVSSIVILYLFSRSAGSIVNFVRGK
jgi:hypothetical protein